MEASVELEKLLAEVRKTIVDNNKFIEKLLDEALEVDSEADQEAIISETDFEEL